MNEKRLKVCYILSYRANNYIRSSSLLRALESSATVDLYVAANISSGIRRYQETLSSLKSIVKTYDPDIFIIGFRGHEIYWPCKFIIKNKPIVFDQMMSPFLSLSEDKKFGWQGKIASFVIKNIERKILHNCSHVITDTESHRQAFSRTFSLSAEKITAIPVGAIENLPSSKEQNQKFTVLYYGSFLPLHGIDQILEASKILKERSIHFQFIGGNETDRKKIINNFQKTDHVSYEHHQWVDFNDLLALYVAQADLVLGGPFGGTMQAQRVITGKTSQSLAQGIATLIGKSEESRIFEHKKNCLLAQQNNPESIAEAIIWAYENQEKLAEIGNAGKKLYETQLSLKKIQEELLFVLSLQKTNAS